MKEHIRQEIEKTQKRNEQMLKTPIPSFYEIDYNRGYIDGLRFVLKLMEKQEMLEKIRTEIDLETRISVKHYTSSDAVIDEVLGIIDKYRELEVQE